MNYIDEWSAGKNHLDVEMRHHQVWVAGMESPQFSCGGSGQVMCCNQQPD